MYSARMENEIGMTEEVVSPPIEEITDEVHPHHMAGQESIHQGHQTQGDGSSPEEIHAGQTHQTGQIQMDGGGGHHAEYHHHHHAHMHHTGIEEVDEDEMNREKKKMRVMGGEGMLHHHNYTQEMEQHHEEMHHHHHHHMHHHNGKEEEFVIHIEPGLVMTHAEHESREVGGVGIMEAQVVQSQTPQVVQEGITIAGHHEGMIIDTSEPHSEERHLVELTEMPVQVVVKEKTTNAIKQKKYREGLKKKQEEIDKRLKDLSEENRMLKEAIERYKHIEHQRNQLAKEIQKYRLQNGEHHLPTGAEGGEFESDLTVDLELIPTLAGSASGLALGANGTAGETPMSPPTESLEVLSSGKAKELIALYREKKKMNFVPDEDEDEYQYESVEKQQVLANGGAHSKLFECYGVSDEQYTGYFTHRKDIVPPYTKSTIIALEDEIYICTKSLECRGQSVGGVCNRCGNARRNYIQRREDQIFSIDQLQQQHLHLHQHNTNTLNINQPSTVTLTTTTTTTTSPSQGSSPLLPTQHQPLLSASAGSVPSTPGASSKRRRSGRTSSGGLSLESDVVLPLPVMPNKPGGRKRTPTKHFEST